MWAVAYLKFKIIFLRICGILHLKMFFADKKLKKTFKSCSEKLKSIFFLTWASQKAQTEEFMFQNVVYRPTLYRTGLFGGRARQGRKKFSPQILTEFLKN